MKKNQVYSKLTGLLVVMLLSFVNASAQNWFHFKEPQQILTSSPDAWIYKVPLDSVYAKAYLQRDVDPNEYWLQKPYAIVPVSKVDSAMDSPLEPGYYLVVHAVDNNIRLQIKRKQGFDVLLSELRKDFYMDVRDNNGDMVNHAKIIHQGKQVAYNDAIEGYPLTIKDDDNISVSIGDDIVFYTCSKKKIVRHKPYNYNDYYDNQQPSYYKGYLVTNQPKYRIGDTVKYKAYILEEDDNYPADEPLQVSLSQVYSKTYAIHSCLPAEKAVYFNEFVLGDSLKSGLYSLTLRGERTGNIISQQFLVDDYLLDQTILQVKGENLPMYQPGDSIHLYGYAATANGLPVLDGKLEITVLPAFSKTNARSVFIPDTLYHRTMDVSPAGETYLGFSTAGFPDADMNLHCMVRLTNSNFETQDTSFTLKYSTAPYYLKVGQSGSKIIAQAIRNKKSVSGVKGKFHFRNTRTDIIFPHEHSIKSSDRQVQYELLKDKERIEMQYYSITADSMMALDEFVNDTAILHIINPQHIKSRYTIFSGNKFIAEGMISGDTTLKARNRKGYDITVMLNYIWAGNAQTKRFEIKRPDKHILIGMQKKDIVYPGQQDNITISLKDLSGAPVTNTNLTVLAFNTQFKEDNVPLPAADVIRHQGLDADKYDKSISLRSYSFYKVLQLSRAWLKRCGADTMFFYDKLALNRERIASYSFSLEDKDAPSQVAIYIRRNNQFVRPAYILARGVPIYIGIADASTDPDNMAIASGTYTFYVRTATDGYTIKDIDIFPHTKNNIFIDGDSISYSQSVDQPCKVLHDTLADTLSYTERDVLARHLFQFRNELSSPAYFSQAYPAYLRLQSEYRNRNHNYTYLNYQLIGPFNMYDSILFIQPGNVQLRFMPESGYITSIRRNMMRVEKSDVYETLRSLHTGNMWPAINKVLPQLEAKEVTVVNTMPVPVPVPDRPLVYAFQNINKYKQTGWAILHIQLLPGKTAQHILFRNEEGNVMIASAAFNKFQLAPGRYDVFVLANDRTFFKSSIDIRTGGINILYHGEATPEFTEKDCPDWLVTHLCVVSGSWQGNQVLWSANDYGSGSSINGKVIDEENEPVIGAIVQVVQGGISLYGTYTDIDGSYTIKPLPPGRYNLKISYIGYKDHHITNVIAPPDKTTYVHVKLHNDGGGTLNEIVVTAYKVPLIDKYNPGTTITLTSDQIEKMPTRSTNGLAATSAGVQQTSNSELSILGSRTEGTLYYIDGVQVRGGANNLTQGTIDHMIRPGAAGAYGDEDGSGDRSRAGIAAGSKKLMKSGKMNDFMNSFMQNASQFSGRRSDFRDWAIWQPNLWTDKDGKTSFSVTYPHNITSWKTYVLAMNKDGYAGRSFHLTRAFKPLAAELSAPRFMRYGDTVYTIGKVMNYTGNAYTVRTAFLYDTTLAYTDSTAVHNAWVKQLQSPAPGNNSRDTASVTLNFSMQTKDGYVDGEERILPVYPVGTIESKGSFTAITGDTSFSSMADTSQYYTGNTRIHIDGNLIEVMLREIENLKLYPHGCTEQLTTKLIAIYYEEEVKNLLGNNKLNNTEAKRKILEKLISAQNKNGSFGWFSGNSADYRITNYVISTMQKVNKDGWLDVIIRRGLAHLNDNLGHMRYEDRIASLATLSASGYASNYKIHLAELQSKPIEAYNKAVLVKIAKEQGLPYRAALDTLMQQRTETRHGVYWGQHSYDWYRNDLATTLLMYQVVNGDSVYDSMKQDIINYLLYKRNTGYYANTAESGLILTTLLPQLLKNNKGGIKRSTEVVIAGKINDTIRSFPYTRELRDNYGPLHFTKQGISPVYISVSYDYLNIAPQTHDGTFKVRTFFMRDKDTLTALKQGDRLIIRTVVDCSKEADYVMVEVPIPAGCVQNLKGNNRNYIESGRENYRDRTAIYCGRLYKGTYIFDVPVEARYKGSYNLSPARAQMMYYADEYGHTEVKKVQIR